MLVPKDYPNKPTDKILDYFKEELNKPITPDIRSFKDFIPLFQYKSKDAMKMVNMNYEKFMGLYRRYCTDIFGTIQKWPYKSLFAKCCDAQILYGAKYFVTNILILLKNPTIEYKYRIRFDDTKYIKYTTMPKDILEKKNKKRLSFIDKLKPPVKKLKILDKHNLSPVANSK